MGLKILLVYLLGILLCQPVYIWGIRTLCRMEDEDEELYCQDNGMYYEPNKPNYPLAIVLLLIAGIFWPLVILFAVFVPLTFLLMDKMGQLQGVRQLYHRIQSESSLGSKRSQVGGDDEQMRTYG